MEGANTLKPSQLRSLQRNRSKPKLDLKCPEPLELVQEEKKVVAPSKRQQLQGKHNLQRTSVKTTSVVNSLSESYVEKSAVVDWSIKTSLALCYQQDLSFLRVLLNQNGLDSNGVTSSASLVNQLNYWRFPYPEVRPELCRKAHQLFHRRSSTLSKEAEATQDNEILFYRTLVSGWRKAFLALYSDLKTTKKDDEEGYFYYFQHDFIVLFRKNVKGGLEAILANGSEGFRSQLRKEGIRFDDITQSICVEDEVEDFEEELLPKTSIQMSASIDLSDVDQENLDPVMIKNQINLRMHRNKVRRISKRVAKYQTILIKDVHMLVDYILNQKDGKSFVLLPELVSPRPFLFGTLCRNEATVHGPDLHGFYRLKLDGMILPGAQRRLVESLCAQLDVERPPQTSSTPDARTESLGALQYSSPKG